jgi:TonB family protein
MRIAACLVIAWCLGGSPATASAQENAEVFKPGDVDSQPAKVSGVVFYSPEAQRERIQGSVHVECIVGIDGVPEKVKVSRSLHPVLDADAVKSVEKWRFKPGMKDGKLVPVQIEIQVSFSLAPAKPEKEKVYEPGDDIVLPVPITEVKPAYPRELMAAGVQGTVLLECVVDTDGTAKAIAVRKPLNPVLDAAAVDALKQWRFEPGRRQGEAVPVRVELEMTFSVR